MKRYTMKNPGGRKTYRIWMDKAGDNSFQSQGNGLFMFGDIVNRLGELEDMFEESEKRSKKTGLPADLLK